MELARRYRAIGGIAGWRTPIFFGVVTAAAIAAGEWTVACLVAGGGLALRVVDRAVVFHVSLTGVTREITVGRTLVTPTRTLAWRSVQEIATRWRRPRDFSALDTIVTAADGSWLSFGMRMGFRAYATRLADVVRHAPHARRIGLTDQVLAETRARRSPS